MNNQSKFSDEQPKLSPFHERQAELNIRDAWSVWNGYKFADYYYEAEYEYFCIRNTCGTYDISPMQKYPFFLNFDECSFEAVKHNSKSSP